MNEPTQTRAQQLIGDFAPKHPSGLLRRMTQSDVLHHGSQRNLSLLRPDDICPAH
jgi:hypothetical protein